MTDERSSSMGQCKLELQIAAHRLRRCARVTTQTSRCCSGALGKMQIAAHPDQNNPKRVSLQPAFDAAAHRGSRFLPRSRRPARRRTRDCFGTRTPEARLWSLKFHRGSRMSGRLAQVAFDAATHRGVWLCSCRGDARIHGPKIASAIKVPGAWPWSLDVSSRAAIVRSGASRVFGLRSLAFDVHERESLRQRERRERCRGRATFHRGSRLSD